MPLTAIESDLRALSAEARSRYPSIKDGAEHAILKLRSLSGPNEIAHNEDILKIILMACEVKNVKLSVIGLSCLQKLILHDAVAPSALKEILATLKEHGEMADESIQLKTLQTILIIFQSHLIPDNEENMSRALGICLRLLESNRSSDSVRNTAAATFRQAVALIFDHVVSSESLPIGKFSSGSYISRTSSVTSDVNRSINSLESFEQEFSSGQFSSKRETLTKSGSLGLRLLGDLTALAAGGSAIWLRVSSIQRTFAFDIIEFVLSNHVALFRTLVPYEQLLRHQICSLLMTSLRTNSELEGEVGEPYFRRLVLRSVAHIIRLYSSSLITETEVFLSMLVKAISLDLPLWHRILVLEILRGFSVEARTLRVLFQNFDMDPKNTNVVEGMVKALARIVSNVQFHETSEESLAAVAGMFSSKAKGIEWSLDNDASNAAVLVASEAHAITLAIEGLLGVVFTVATLTDDAVDVGEIESPRGDDDTPANWSGRTASLCLSMVDSMWLTILDALSLILEKSQGEAIILEILKGYQAFTQACGVLRTVEPLNSFLASLCKFTISIPVEVERRSAVQSSGSRRLDLSVDQRESIVLTPKNVQALRTLFNIAHRLHNVLGPSWVLVLETLSALDRAIHSPHATTQEVSGVPRLTRDSSSQYSDFNILSSLNSQLFESSGLMHVSAVKSLLLALRQLSYQCMATAVNSAGQSSGQKIGSISFSLERMLSILVNNLHRVQPLWNDVVDHFLELGDCPNQKLRIMALDAMDKSICSVLASDHFQDLVPSKPSVVSDNVKSEHAELISLECAVISPLKVLYCSPKNVDVRVGSLKILLHVLERYGEKLHYSWPDILELLRSVAQASEKDLITLGFQSLRVIMNDGLSTVPADCLQVCIDVAGAYGAQRTDLNISLTAIGLLWTSTDFIVKGLIYGPTEVIETAHEESKIQKDEELSPNSYSKSSDQVSMLNNIVDCDKILILIFTLLQSLGADGRPEVRNSAVRTLFQILGSHGQKLSKSMWEDCLWNYVFPTLERASHMVATSSKDEWQGKELGTRGGKAVHMLIHHSRNTAQKQWDETLVLILAGIARILRSFFPFLRSLNNFQSGWDSLLLIVKNSILNGSKEVVLAAINCLQSTVVSHSPKGNLPLEYLVSVLCIYEFALQKSPSFSDGAAASKVKQEILQGLGELYVQAQGMFDSGMYNELLSIFNSAIKQAKTVSNNFEAEYGHVPPLQRALLEILPLLRPAEHLSEMWSPFLGTLLRYLPRAYPSENDSEEHLEKATSEDNVKDLDHSLEAPNGIPLTSPNAKLPRSTETNMTANNLFAEKLVPVIIVLFLHAPPNEKYNNFPDVVQGLGRCMTTRRDHPDGRLWRLAIEGFNKILVDDVIGVTVNFGLDVNLSKGTRIRVWKEVADIYEVFLVGYCGRALFSDVLSSAALTADEALEMNTLGILGDKILKSQINMPLDILQRLVTTLDRCASRTSTLPVETVELMPSHCSRFSMTCLQKLFSLSSYEADDWNSTRSEVSKISVKILLSRCELIIQKFLTDEDDLGARAFPLARVDEIIFVLKELARLIIHLDTASVLPLSPYLKKGFMEENHNSRSHLFVLFPSFCELVISRESRVRELVQVLLRLISSDLGLEKQSLAS